MARRSRDVPAPKIAKPWLPLFMRRTVRRTWRWLTHPHLQVVYHDDYNTAFPNIPNDPLRAERILAFLAAEGLVVKSDVYQPRPIPLKTLAKVHAADYLERLHDPAALTSVMGVEITPDQVDRLLDQQRLQVGGTLLALRLALKNGLAVNLAGGLHHAHAEMGGGFCIWNDVAVAVAEERERGFRGRILVVDLDLHDGDGNRAIFKDDPDVFTFSIHARSWEETAATASFSLELGSDVDDEVYLDALDRHLPRVFEEYRPDLVIYLAGTDPAREDQLGEWQITPRGMLARDVRVASLARGRRRKVPLLVLLAGGYSFEAWRYTARFLSDPLGDRGTIEPPSTEDMTLKRYRYISSLFDPAELSGGTAENPFALTEEDLYLPGWNAHKETRFLGYYSRHGIELVLERTGILDRLRDLGFTHPTLEFDLDEPSGHTVRTFASPAREEVLTELRVRRDRRTVQGMVLLSVEWLLLQNPRAEFGPGRPRLPGQQHPGLGMLDDMVALLTVACERLHFDGMICVPSHYHVAVQWYGRMHFLTAEAQGRFDALTELLAGLPLPEATQAVAEGRVMDDTAGEVFRWRPEPMVAPISQRLHDAWKPHRVRPEDRPCYLRLLPAAPWIP